MSKKSIFKLFIILTGVIMMLLSLGIVQASEITSVFSGETISRNTINNEGKRLGISIIRKSGDWYAWNPTTDGLDKEGSIIIDKDNKVQAYRAWKITQIDSNNQKNYSNLYYCLNALRGFGIINGDMAEGAIDDYTSYIDFKNTNNKANITEYAGGSLGTNYNKVLWILENIYMPTGNSSYKTSNEYKTLMKNAGITIENDQFDLTEEQIDVVQQMAIWYFTNAEDTANYHLASGSLPSMYLNGTQLSQIYYGTTEYGEQITGKIIYNKMNTLYKYFINNASSTYTQSIPTLTLSNSVVKVSEEDSNYIVGPFKLTGTNTNIIKEIKAEVNVDYTLLDLSKKTVDNFNEVIGKEFYLQIPKSKIKETTQLNIKLTYKYDTRKLTLLTNVNDYKNTQPVVLIGNEEKSLSTETNAKIDLIDISVVKRWDDNDNQDGKRNEYGITLKADGKPYGKEVKLNKDTLTYKWEDLLRYKDGKEIVYTVEETTVPTGYTAQYSEDTFTITNKYTPETINISGTKTWEDNNNQDGKRPESIVVNLLANGNKIKDITVTAENNWNYEFSNLPKKEAGKEIVYTITEEIVPEYATTIKGYNITNKYTPGVVNKTVIKKWNDNNNQDNIRTTNVEVQLYKTVEQTRTSMGEEYKIELNKENNWTYTWENLPLKENGKEIVYSVEEIEVPAGYTVGYSAQDYSKTNEITITNTHIPAILSKTVIKQWNDNDNKDKIRPEKIEVQLYKTVEETKTSMGKDYKIELNESNNWTYKWENLAVKQDGKEIIYSVEEVEVPEGYTVEYSSEDYSNTNEIIITNTHIPNKFDLALRKFITKVNGIEYSREPFVDTSTIKSTGTATYKHTKDPIAVQKGDIVTYTIRVYNEGEVDGYVDKITDYVPKNLVPIIEGINGIDTNTYSKEIEFNSNWLWLYAEDERTITTTITSKLNTETYSILTGIEEVTDTKLNAYVEGSDKLDYIDVQIKCLVANDAVDGEFLTNIAEITESQDINGNKGDGADSSFGNVDYSNLSDYKNDKAIGSTKDSYIPGQEDDDDFEKLEVKEFDLALRKFITKVDETTYSREPIVDTSKLGTVIDNKVITTAIYKHSKESVIVKTNDIVTYTIRIYNEGTLPGFANEVTDNIPEGLEFLTDSKVNITYKWKMLDSEGKETTDKTKAVMIVTDYLSDSIETNIIKARTEKEGAKTLDYKDIQVQFKVVAQPKKSEDNIIINEAQISEDNDRDIDSIPNRDEKYNYTTNNNEDDIDYEPIKLQYFDLALRKFVTKVNEVEYNNRYPEIIYNEDGSINYKHTKDPVLVTNGDTVIYTIRVYNEGEIAGYASEIKDNLPQGLAFDPNNETNKEYKWKMVDSEGKVTEDVEKVVGFTTDYLKNEKIDALVESNSSKILSYKDVQIAFIVTESELSDRILVNIAQISEDSDDDIDSIPNNNIETEDDTDKEYIRVEYFDLAIKKWVTETRVTLDGKTAVTKTGFTEDSEGIAKVDIVASKLKKTTVKFAYNIKVINEGELPGYAYEVKDYIPKGFEFVAEENKDWKEIKDGIVVTDKLKDTLLNPGESATVEIVLTWKNASTNLGIKTNYAEISSDSANDIDSTPDNYDFTEDDMDDAQVILSIKTAGATTYIGLILITVSILASGILLIKKYVLN